MMMNTTYENVWTEIEVCLSDMSPKTYDISLSNSQIFDNIFRLFIVEKALNIARSLEFIRSMFYYKL